MQKINWFSNDILHYVLHFSKVLACYMVLLNIWLLSGIFNFPYIPLQGNRKLPAVTLPDITFFVVYKRKM